MNDDMDLSQILTQTMKFLGYSDKLTTKALGDLERVIAVRFYNKIVAICPHSTTKDIEANDYQAIIEVARQNIDKITLQDCLVEITRETIDEYVSAITSK